MKNLITILFLCSFLFSQTNHNDSLIQVSSSDSRWFMFEGNLHVENKFTNLSNKEITDFKYEISVYDKDNNLINTFLNDYKTPFFFLDKTIQQKESVKKSYKISRRQLKFGWVKDWKVKIRFIEVTFSDGTIIDYSTNLIDIKRDQLKPIKYVLGGIVLFCVVWGLVGDDS